MHRELLGIVFSWQQQQQNITVNVQKALLFAPWLLNHCSLTVQSCYSVLLLSLPSQHFLPLLCCL